MSIKEKVFIKRIIDGDTFETKKGRIIRLANVNFPEKREKGYKESKKYLQKALPVNSFAYIESVANDKYNRTIAIVSNWSQNINRKLKKFLQRLF